MNRARRVLERSVADQVLLLRALLVVSLVRLGLWLLPFKTMLRLVEYGGAHAGGHAPIFAARIAWAVTSASRVVPVASCLTQALAAQLLLRRSGLHATLRIGVVKTGTGRLEAHAWLEDHGRVLIGALPNLGHYTQLPPLQAARS